MAQFTLWRNRNLTKPEYDRLIESLPNDLQAEPEFREKLDEVIDYVAANSRWSNVDVARALLRLISFVCSSTPVARA